MGILGLDARELSVALVGDEEMRVLNRQYRGRDQATDVLAFALDDVAPRAHEEYEAAGAVVPADDAHRTSSRGGRSAQRAPRHDARRPRAGRGIGGLSSSSLLGDVVISVDTAIVQARERRRSVEQTLDELLVHGVLHLIGYDHEISAAEARRMFGKAREVEAALGKSPRSKTAPAGAGAKRRANTGTVDGARTKTPKGAPR